MKYAVIQKEHITGATFVDTVIYTGTKEECAKVETEARKTYSDTTQIDCYTINIDEYIKQAEYIKALNEYAATLTSEQRKETILVDGKKCAKYIHDFRKEYFK